MAEKRIEMHTIRNSVFLTRAKVWRRKDCGATLLEYAFIAVLLMLILYGIMGFGHALYAYHFVNHVAKEATRWAAVNGSACSLDTSCNGAGYMNNGPATATDINTYVQNHIPPGIVASSVNT